MRILIAEASDLGRVFQKVLEQQGHQVTWYRGFASVEPLVGLIGKNYETLVSETFDIAFVDGFMGETVKGPQVVPKLKARGIRVVGIACMPDNNVKLQEAQADLAIHKAAALAALYTKTLTPELAMSPSAQLQEKLVAFEVTHRKDEATIKAIEAMIRECLLAAA